MATCIFEQENETEFQIQEFTVAELVLAAQDGDRDAFGTLVERYQRAVYHNALKRVRDHAEAQELVQEVFVQALRKINQLRTPECFGGWLRQITHRLAINRAVRRPQEQAVENDSLELNFVEERTPQAIVLEKEQAKQVRAGLKRLKTLDRNTLVAFYVDGQSLAEMSVRFDSPIGTIKRRLHTARKRLAAELEELQTA
ncbi:MAG: sigma-70 family RNA polymerase sigma factor [Planctomycetaceae bacterium]|nr:sigma-70 family RNA polymerase sigma factor [Planctomycetaceae bacterium]